MCFMGVILGKGHSVREWGHFQKKNFYIFSVFIEKQASKGDPQNGQNPKKTSLEPVLK